MKNFKKLLISLCFMYSFAAEGFARNIASKFTSTLIRKNFAIAAGLVAATIPVKTFSQSKDPFLNEKGVIHNLGKFFSQFQPVPEYTINLMWINKTLKTDQKYIFPVQNEKELKEAYLDSLIGWAESNTTATIHLWYDSFFTSKQACLNTLKEINKHTTRPIILKDVREIPDVQKHAEIFSDKTPVYFRADLLRVMAAVHTLSTNKADNFVYADLDIKPISKEELFDLKTLEYLKKFGIVMASYHGGFENGFQITNKHNKDGIAAIQRALIDINIQRTHEALQYKRHISPQLIYDSYEKMFHYLYHLQGLGTLTLSDKCILDDGKEYGRAIYDHEKHGLEPFGKLASFSYRHSRDKCTLSFQPEFSYRADTKPTKDVKYPQISMNYE